jgi:hypothetical protein
MTRGVLGPALALLGRSAPSPSGGGVTPSRRGLDGGVPSAGAARDTGLYTGGRPGEVDPATARSRRSTRSGRTGSTKRRWVYLPPGPTIDARDEHAWDFRSARASGRSSAAAARKVETRLCGGDRRVGVRQLRLERPRAPMRCWRRPRARSRRSRSPLAKRARRARRHRLHRLSRRFSRRPLGFTALQLSPDRDPNAIHGEPLAPNMLTLRRSWTSGACRAPDGTRSAPRIRTSDPATRAVLGYLAANCGACHDGRGDIAAFAHDTRIRDLSPTATPWHAASSARPRGGRSRGNPTGERARAVRAPRAERAARAAALARAVVADAAARYGGAR